jgi:hypothetical protein
MASSSRAQQRDLDRRRRREEVHRFSDLAFDLAFASVLCELRVLASGWLEWPCLLYVQRDIHRESTGRDVELPDSSDPAIEGHVSSFPQCLLGCYA